MNYKIIALVFAFMIGSVLGSAFLCMLDRRERKEKWTKGRSHCTACGHELAARDLIPIVSYLSLKGKCRYCKKPFSPAALFSELTMGCAALFAASAAFWKAASGNYPAAAADALIYLLLGLGAVNDIYCHECEYVIQYTALMTGSVYALLFRGHRQLLVMIAVFAVLSMTDYVFCRMKKVDSAIGRADIVMLTGAAGILHPFSISVALFLSCVFALLFIPIARINQTAQGTAEEETGIGLLPFVLFGTFAAQVLSAII